MRLTEVWEQVSKLSDEWIENSRYKYHHPSTPQSEKDIIERLFKRKGHHLGDQAHYTKARPTDASAARGANRPPPRPPGGGGYAGRTNRPGSNWWENTSAGPRPGGGTNYQEEASRRVREEQERRAREHAHQQSRQRAYESDWDATKVRHARQAGTRQGQFNSAWLRKPAKTSHLTGHGGRIGMAGVAATGAAFGAGSYLSNRKRRVTKALVGYNPKEKKQQNRDAALRGVGAGLGAGGLVAAGTAPRRYQAASQLDDYAHQASKTPRSHYVGHVYDPDTQRRAQEAFRQGYHAEMPSTGAVQEARRLASTLKGSANRRAGGGIIAGTTGLAAMAVAHNRMASRDRRVQRRRKAAKG